MHLIIFIFFVLWLSYCLAMLEIQIEGAHGWAEQLPVWRLSMDNWFSKILFSDRPLTGYHVWMVSFLVSMLHLIYVFVLPSWNIELQIIAFFCFFSVSEDFLWFVLNPAFGIRNFRPDKIWWHAKSWWIFAPRDYYLLVSIGVITYLLSGLV
jgi:hypothetical protein